jgi:hypothetical protein
MMRAILRLAGLGVCVATGLIPVSAPVYADAQTRKDEGHRAAPAVKQGQKWATDESMRRGMNAIRQTMIANHEAIEQARLSTQDYQRLAAAVGKETADMVKSSRLGKEADAAFHAIVLTDLTQSTELMRISPKVQVQRAGALGVLQSLRNYGEYFQHPGWDIGPAKAP